MLQVYVHFKSEAFAGSHPMVGEIDNSLTSGIKRFWLALLFDAPGYAAAWK